MAMDSHADGPWRPTVALGQRHALGKRRALRPLPGQLYLPGMESINLPAEIQPRTGTPTCPNCGGHAFDDDGDCTNCWEPGVVERI